jgi:hypothetical protein
MEQVYIDRFGSIEEKLTFKKSRKYAAFPVKFDLYGQSVYCGNGTTFLPSTLGRSSVTGMNLSLSIESSLMGAIR